MSHDDDEIMLFHIDPELVSDLRSEGVLPPWDMQPRELGMLLINYLDQYVGVEDVPVLAQRLFDALNDANRVTVH